MVVYDWLNLYSKTWYNEIWYNESVVGFTIVIVHRFDDDSDRNRMKQYEQIIQ